ncbi:MAG: RNA pseudouridine synthase [Pseudomonadota bacterium]
MAHSFETHVSVAVGTPTAVALLHETSDLPKQRIKDAMMKGAVWLTRSGYTQRLRRASRQLRERDTLHLYYDDRVLNETPQAPLLIADNGGYSVWNKPYGLRSQGSKWGDHCTLMRWAEQHLEPPRTAFTVHRLDRAANGLMLVAHAKTTAAALAKLFRERHVEKHYQALVVGDCSALTDTLVIDEALDGKRASTEVRLRQVVDAGERSWLDVQIHTGRKHQIRRHLAGIGHPVVGDRLYGTGVADGIDLQLTACLLAFDCPLSGARVEFRL